MAFDLLTDDEKAKIVSLMQKHPRYADDFSPPPNLPNEDEQLRWRIGRIGYWPDVARKQPLYDRPTWHYQLGATLVIGDRSKLSILDDPGPLPSGATLKTQELYIAQAIELCQKVMGDATQSDEDRAVAMCWIAHLVADAHQPCHAGSLYMEGVFEEADGDRGANRILTKQRRNMHALWDQLLGTGYDVADVRRRMFEIRSYDIAMRSAEESVANEIGMDPFTWLEESRALARLNVYTPEVMDPLERASRMQGNELEKVDLPEEYLKAAGRVARARAAHAALRLSNFWKQNLD